MCVTDEKNVTLAICGPSAPYWFSFPSVSSVHAGCLLTAFKQTARRLFGLFAVFRAYVSKLFVTRVLAPVEPRQHGAEFGDRWRQLL